MSMKRGTTLRLYCMKVSPGTDFKRPKAGPMSPLIKANPINPTTVIPKPIGILMKIINSRRRIPIYPIVVGARRLADIS